MNKLARWVSTIDGMFVSVSNIESVCIFTKEHLVKCVLSDMILVKFITTSGKEYECDLAEQEFVVKKETIKEKDIERAFFYFLELIEDNKRK